MTLMHAGYRFQFDSFQVLHTIQLQLGLSVISSSASASPFLHACAHELFMPERLLNLDSVCLFALCANLDYCLNVPSLSYLSTPGKSQFTSKEQQGDLNSKRQQLPYTCHVIALPLHYMNHTCKQFFILYLLTSISHFL